MKRFYSLFAAMTLLTAASAQNAFWSVVPYKGAFPVTDNTPATDWTSGWANFDPENTVYAATTQTVSANITTNTTWSGVILLQNKVYVKNNAVLTILPGTIIRGDFATQGTLIITRGAKLNAIGTVSQPIVFTSNNAPGARQEGDWGGVVILGLARNNQPGGVANIEGILATTDTQFGGAFDNDDSGTLKYVRIEFGGIPLEPNKEINGITFGSVGSETEVDYVQVSFSGDDAFEWFGGTVNCKHLISYRSLDDDFDTDFGFRGKVQFGLIIRDKDLSDAAGDSNAFESDNDAAGSVAQPKTMPIFSNITIVGPKGNGTTVLPVGEKFEKAFRLRRNTSTSVFNSLITGWEKGLSVEGAAAEANVNGDSLVFASNVISNTAPANCVTGSAAFYSTFFNADGNDSTSTIAQVNWVNLFPGLGITPDARLNGASVAATGANFTHIKFYNVAMPTVANNSIEYCQDETSTALAATASAGNTLNWFTQATGGTASSVAPVPSTTTPGTFNYYVSQSNAAGDQSMRVLITVTVHATPATPTVTASGPTSFCTGGSVVLTSSQATGNNWSNNATTASITVTASGTFSVTYTDNNGCSASSSVTNVSVSNAPVPTINASATAACSGDSIVLTSSTADSYLWSTNATTQSITVTSTGNYTVTTTNADACAGVGTSAPTAITFGTTPTANATFTVSGNVVTFTNTSTDATTYSWDFDDFSGSSAASPVHAFAANGSYDVVLTAINGNCTSTFTITIAISVGLEEFTGLTEVVLFPNPTNGDAVLTFSSETNESAQTMIIDQLGKVVSSRSIEIQTGANTVAINADQLGNGMYTIMLNTDRGTIVRKMIVQK
ncbi:MAG: T9SS type A sorting domain-containing protein [Flavobacteriia bacterium]|jgi:PKD repeat protein|nr:T9SS type A sorting domain-containing protein [Cryomorphaceae bacterium]